MSKGAHRLLESSARWEAVPQFTEEDAEGQGGSDPGGAGPIGQDTDLPDRIGSEAERPPRPRRSRPSSTHREKPAEHGHVFQPTPLQRPRGCVTSGSEWKRRGRWWRGLEIPARRWVPNGAVTLLSCGRRPLALSRPHFPTCPEGSCFLRGRERCEGLRGDVCRIFGRAWHRRAGEE